MNKATWIAAGVLVLCATQTETLFADAPVGRYAISTSIVIDQRTGLTWQRTEARGYSQSAAISYCAAPNPLLPGTGWRLPSVAELQSVIDDSRWRPAIDPKAFPNTPAAGFWTSSPSANSSGFGWYVDFDLGLATTRPTSETLAVRCVR